ncbi:MAG: hypothetical protein M3O30_11110 [Planctomycetota bacterium]|nr:hypothetical protein [Planctomycetota bacterium]
MNTSLESSDAAEHASGATDVVEKQSETSLRDWRGLVWHWGLPVLIAAAFTAIAMVLIVRHGRLAIPPILDDAGYFVDGASRLAAWKTHGFLTMGSGLLARPPHSPFSTALAMLAFGIFGVHAWAGYLFNGLIIVFFLCVVDAFTRCGRLRERLLIFGLALSAPYAWVAVAAFRPDTTWGMVTSAAILATLRKPLALGGVRRWVFVGTCWALAMLVKPSTAPATIAMGGAAVILALVCDFQAGARVEWLIRCGCLMLVTGLMIAGPYYLTAWRDVLDYFSSNALGAHKSWWAVPGDFWFQARFYVDGKAGKVMLGWHLWVLLALGISGAILKFRLSPALRWRIIAWD